MLTHVADRVQALHAAGYVRRDIKPGNVLWLPRKKRWTLIDFGCVARTGERAGIGFTLSFAAPEVIAAHRAQQQRGAAQHDGIIATEANDAWSMGILAIEVFTGKPAFGIFHDKQMVRASSDTLQFRLTLEPYMCSIDNEPLHRPALQTCLQSLA